MRALYSFQRASSHSGDDRACLVVVVGSGRVSNCAANTRGFKEPVFDMVVIYCGYWLVSYLMFYTFRAHMFFSLCHIRYLFVCSK